MSNRFGSNDDDFDFPDDDFDFNDLRGDTGDDFDFDSGVDDSGSYTFDDDDDLGEPSDFNFGDSDEPDFDDLGEAEGGGPNRAFIFAAVGLIALVVGGLVLILLLSNRGPTPEEIAFNASSTAIIETNDAVFALSTQTAQALIVEQTALPLTETAVSIELTNDAVASAQAATETAAFAATATQDEINRLATIDAQPTATNTLSPDEIAATQTAEAPLVETEVAVGASPTIEAPIGTINADNVALTATALFLTLQPQVVVPSPGSGGGGDFPTREALPDVLPEGGLFDDFIGSSGGMGAVALMAFGLVGVIFVSRKLRSWNK